MEELWLQLLGLRTPYWGWGRNMRTSGSSEPSQGPFPGSEVPLRSMAM